MDFKLAPAKAVLGAPFEGEYHLVWNATVTLPMQPCGNDPNLWIEVRLPNGASKSWATGTVPAALPIRAPVTIEKGQPAGYSIDYSNIVETTCAPGLYGVRLRYRVDTGWNNYDAFWKGEAVSNWVNIEITAPEGEDAAIWTRFRAQVPDGACWDFHRWAVYHGAEILVSFPSSTYAAYVVYEASGAKGLMSSDPAYVCQSIAEGSFLSSGSVPDDTGKCKDGWQSLTMEGVLKWREKWFSIVLKKHPDIWFADELRLKKAVDQIALKNYQAGAADLEQLCASAKPDVAEKARQYLGLIKQKGWIKE
jgi:hypothetical protein